MLGEKVEKKGDERESSSEKIVLLNKTLCVCWKGLVSVVFGKSEVTLFSIRKLSLIVIP